MSTHDDITTLRGDGDLPSELALDQRHLGELSPHQDEKVRAQAAQTEAGQRAMAEREEGFDAYPELDADAVLARVHAQLAGQDLPAPAQALVGELTGLKVTSSGSGAARRWLRPLLAAGALAAVTVVGTTYLPLTDDFGEGVRAKGGPGLHLYRLQGAQVTEVQSGDTVHPGDAIRLRIDAPDTGHLMVVGVEASGTVYPIHPRDAVDAAAVEAGPGQEIPGGFTLDDSLGREWMHVVLCPAPFAFGALGVETPGGPLTTPEGCRQGAFALEKTAP